MARTTVATLVEELDRVVAYAESLKARAQEAQELLVEAESIDQLYDDSKLARQINWKFAGVVRSIRGAQRESQEVYQVYIQNIP